jgi:hypothetical protein
MLHREGGCCLTGEGTNSVYCFINIHVIVVKHWWQLTALLMVTQHQPPCTCAHSMQAL